METLINTIGGQLALILTIVFGLMILVNIFTEVLKKVFTTIPTNLLVLVLALIITGAAMYVYLSAMGIRFMWWMIFVAIAIAFAVAYSAMFGFDKLKQMIEQWRNVN